MREPVLEPLLRKIRIAKVFPLLRRIPQCRLLDIGCGWEAKFLLDVEPYIACGVGIDFKAPLIQTEKLTTMCVRLDGTLPFADNSFDVVTMLAVLEHLDRPKSMLREVCRVLRPNSFLAATVPSNAAKPILEFLSYRIGIVNQDEIRDHKQYYNRNSIVALLSTTGFTDIKHQYFQFGLNNYFLASVHKILL
ncbi:MAG: class I SAM-dependent methyltransferase [Clostridiales bacterium]|jgi:2-polyprenyl-3-methyl-5-hydroxy-6-metoxy-1,4-benzoquinol methylase|nr:class I SAM-dependent methyltransferase [Clostridiales bacterium]